LHSTASDVDPLGQVAQPNRRLLGNSNQDFGMVAEKSPTGRSCLHLERRTASRA
jgi:hypothetical protein